MKIEGSDSCGQCRSHTASMYRSARFISDAPSPNACVAIATGRQPGAVNTCNRNDDRPTVNDRHRPMPR